MTCCGLLCCRLCMYIACYETLTGVVGSFPVQSLQNFPTLLAFSGTSLFIFHFSLDLVLFYFFPFSILIFLCSEFQFFKDYLKIAVFPAESAPCQSFESYTLDDHVWLQTFLLWQRSTSGTENLLFVCPLRQLALSILLYMTLYQSPWVYCGAFNSLILCSAVTLC